MHVKIEQLRLIHSFAPWQVSSQMHQSYQGWVRQNGVFWMPRVQTGDWTLELARWLHGCLCSREWGTCQCWQGCCVQASRETKRLKVGSSFNGSQTGAWCKFFKSALSPWLLPVLNTWSCGGSATHHVRLSTGWYLRWGQHGHFIKELPGSR